ncbi:MAG: DUF2007 domain-containing protein [Muribaculaceae bacterium]|nr:DUF2007 domain-containing protein [Muribaculaceae bacterium]MDE6755456.1 DUF2007 domain-containing protein [Muribaculaceae bacterium]
MDSTVTLVTYSTLEEAYIVKGMLESHGIPALVRNENNLYVPIFDGVSVVIFEKDWDKAQKLLVEYGDR